MPNNLIYKNRKRNFKYILTLQSSEMISEKQINQQIPKSNLETKNNSDQISMEFLAPTEFGRMKAAFRQKIRNQQLDKMKAQKRKQHQIHLAIQSVLQSDFPKESSQAKDWANQLNELYQQSPNYETDPHKLREIFLFAQRFPSLGTLRLFYFAVLTTEDKNIKTLADVDVWTFLHSILKDSAQKQISPLAFGSKSSETGSFSLSLVPQAIDQTELEMVKLVIRIFIIMFDKELTMRDYSIGTHTTYTTYLRNCYRKFGDRIRTEMIYFLLATLKHPPRQYKKDYLCLIRLAIGMLHEYFDKVELFLHRKEWVSEGISETIQQAITRISILYSLLCKSFEHANTKWLIEFLDPKNSTINFDYFRNTNEFLNFGLWVLGQLVQSKNYNEMFYATFGKTIEMMYNSFYFYMIISEKANNLQPDDSLSIRQIVGKIVLMLNFLKNCEQNRVLSHAEKDVIEHVQNTKHICLFSLESTLNSEFDTYENFSRNIIFYSDSEGNQINLLELIVYFIKTVYGDKAMSDLIRLIFTLLKTEVPFEQLQRFSILPTIFEQLIEMIDQKVVTAEIKTTIIEFLSIFFFEKSRSTSIGSAFGIENILIRNLHRIEEFMYSNKCTNQIYTETERLIQFAHQLKINQENN